jgi:hypothetical protein
MFTDLTPIHVCDSYRALLHMGQNDYGTLYTGTGSALPIEFLNSEVIKLSTFTPSYGISILNTLSSSSFTSRPQTAFTEVSSSSFISYDNTSTYASIASAYNVMCLDRSASSISQVCNSFIFSDGLSGARNSTDLNSFQGTTDCNLYNSTIASGAAQICYGNNNCNSLLYRNNFYGVSPFVSGGVTCCAVNNRNSTILTPNKSVLISYNCNTFSHTNARCSTNSYPPSDCGSINTSSLYANQNIGQRMFGAFPSSGDSGILNTVDSYIVSADGVSADPNVQRSFHVGGGTLLSSYDSSVMTNGSYYYECICCSHISYAVTDICNISNSFYLCHPTSTGNNVFKSSSGYSCICDDSVQASCMFVYPDRFSIDDSLIENVGPYSMSVGGGSYLCASNSANTSIISNDICSGNNSYLGPTVCISTMTSSRNAASVGCAATGSNYLNLLKCVTSVQQGYASLFTCCNICQSNIVHMDCVIINNIPTSSAGLPVGHLWTCFPGDALRIVI